MKNTLKTIGLIGSMALLGSCSDSFIEVKPKSQVLEANYYKDAAEAFNGIVAAYDELGREAGGTYANKLGPLNAASDDCYAGGGSSSDMSTWQVWNNYTVSEAQGPQAELWSRNFSGIYRANVILSKLDGVKNIDESLRARFKAEAKFLRAYYYFDLVRLFKNVPLFTEPVSANAINTPKQAAPEEVYAQIEKDLNEAIPDLPAKVPADTEGGRATSGAATALLAKVIITQNDANRMMDAANLLADVNGTPGQLNAKYGYQLLSNYGDIFRPDNKFHSESIFEIVHVATKATWGGWPNFEGNVATTMFGPRGYTGPFYMSGWGFNPLTLDLVNQLKNDPRYKYTVANVDSIVAATNGTAYEHGYDNTGYFIQKFAPLQAFKATEGNWELNYLQNVIEIRLADTYLLEAEALVRANQQQARAQALLDAVRARVGLPSVTATLDNIAHERRLELATEGHRFFDLVRTGKAAEALAFKGFVAGKNEILPIPQRDLRGTNLVQNPNY